VSPDAYLTSSGTWVFSLLPAKATSPIATTANNKHTVLPKEDVIIAKYPLQYLQVNYNDKATNMNDLILITELRSGSFLFALCNVIIYAIYGQKKDFSPEY
jgi:hypothetical protein